MHGTTLLGRLFLLPYLYSYVTHHRRLDGAGLMKTRLLAIELFLLLLLLLLLLHLCMLKNTLPSHTLSCPERILPFNSCSLARILATPLCIHESFSPLHSKSVGQFCKQKNGNVCINLCKIFGTNTNQPTKLLKLCRELQVCLGYST